jgi:hypothetical protein
MEFLGVAASAAQLVAYGISIASSIAIICERVRDAPQQYHEYSCQVKLLINTARIIEQNPVLQIAEVNCHLSATLVEAQTLQSMLECATASFKKSSIKRRFWSAIKGKEQRKIFEHLENLQRMKTALLLCISTVHTTQLSNIEESVEQLLDINAESSQNSSENKRIEVSS